MKSLIYTLISSFMLVLILAGNTILVSAKGEMPKLTVTVSTDDIYHIGGALSLSVSITDPTNVQNLIIDWGDGSVEEGFTFEGSTFVTRNHLYNQPGQISIVVIAVMPFEEQTGDSADLYVMNAQETTDWLIANVDNLVQDDGLSPDEGQSLINQLDEVLVALEQEDLETAVEELNAYIIELEEYIAEGLVPEDDPGKTVADDMAYYLLADPRPSPGDGLPEW